MWLVACWIYGLTTQNGDDDEDDWNCCERLWDSPLWARVRTVGYHITVQYSTVQYSMNRELFFLHCMQDVEAARSGGRTDLA
jgi:hypothetical protein